MKIHDFAGFPNPSRVRIALREKNAFDKVTFVPVDVPGGEHKTPEFRALNPSCAVPVLELDNDTYLSECTAITEYLDATFEGPSLSGRTPEERATIHMMQRRAESNVMDAVADYFHQATPGLGPDIEGVQVPEWGQRRKEVAVSGMKYFDSVLAEQTYLAGDDFSMADITLYMGLEFADLVKIEIPSTLTHLIDWRQRVAARPSVKATLAG